jgi:hypothetical protein
MAKSTPKSIPSLGDVSPDYVALEAKKAELHARRMALSTEENALRERLASPRPDGGRGARVGALLGDDIAEHVDPATRLTAINSLYGDIRSALAEVESRIAVARVAASRTICEGVRGQHQANVATLARSLVAAHDAHRAYASLVADLDAEGVAWTGHLPVMTPRRILGDVRDSHGLLGRYLQEAATLGFISSAEIPKELL